MIPRGGGSRRFLLTGMLLILFVPFQTVTAVDHGEQESLPVTISSDRMRGDFNAGVFTFLDSVKVVRGDMVLHADAVEVHPAEGGEDIERIVATGHVQVMTGTRSSVSDRVEYLQQGALLILTGNARVSDGNNTIVGPLIRVYLDEDRAEVEGSPSERPTFLFHPETMKSGPSKEKE